jgi:hypothetical protein
MLIKNSKPFNIGALFAVTFLGVLFMIFSPVFQGKNGLEFADESFNKLAKGSSYFIPKVAKSVESSAANLSRSTSASRRAKMPSIPGRS